ncbi:hypothetical protein [Billgrantia kenyensis]|uniref:Uncharacterized protein n=1 Tax=Billgrantia kenyensis TaxID=321266 RepID=A0A7W0ACG0_9GAMM|nr:hypothetical protein [Halomonas kenyensis]MBA2778176.1 hypothetical protein [Halomonas kenyensis]MCG6661045.1 hypothetical protein [Halomonas kenyensis]
MTTEPQRLQYLEAMGLTAWVARYQLPHARPSEACEWQLPEREAPAPPAERLHALLDEAEEAAQQPPKPAAEPPRAVPARRARQLLGIEPANDEAAPVADSEVVEELPRQVQEPLRFTLQVGSLAGRWLVIVPGEAAPDASQGQLLSNLLQAGGIPIPSPLVFETFRWPPMENLPVEAPLDEARQGLHAFIEGTRRRGWAPERILIFGRDADLERLLDLQQGHFELQGLVGWQGPGLAELARSAQAKRELWPSLLEWQRVWSEATEADD